MGWHVISPSGGARPWAQGFQSAGGTLTAVKRTLRGHARVEWALTARSEGIGPATLWRGTVNGTIVHAQS